MLMATYSFCVIAAEQKRLHSRIERLQQDVVDGARQKQNVGAAAVQLLRLHTDFQLRKIQTHVVPALSGLGGDAASLLSEIESLRAEAAHLSSTLAEKLSAPVETTPCEILVGLHQRCLACLRERLVKEDQQLIPLAWRALSPRQWFAIGAACLAERQLPGTVSPDAEVSTEGVFDRLPS